MKKKVEKRIEEIYLNEEMIEALENDTELTQTVLYAPSKVVVKLDLNFILDNYERPGLWKKKWTIFKYKDYEIDISIHSIEVKYDRVKFDIRLLKKGVELSGSYLTLNANKGNRNITALRNNLNGEVYRIFNRVNDIITESSWEYKKARELEYSEQELLENAAIELLDELKVTHEDIRDAYIEAQTNKYTNRTISILRSNEYRKITHLYLSFALFVDDKKMYEKINEKILKFDKKRYNKIKGEIMSGLTKIKNGKFEETVKDLLDEFK